MSKAKVAQLIVSGTGEFVSEVLVSARLRNSGDHGFDCDPDGRNPSRTSQEFADECDVNNIMKQYYRTGVMPRYGEREPTYIDWSEPVSFMDAMNLQIAADDAFGRLPAAVRKEFDNDPLKFIDYAMKSPTDEAASKRMVEWGLSKAPDAPPAPVRVEITNPPAAPQGGSPADPAAVK